MKLLIDTNVVLDYLGVNEGFSEDAEAIFNLALNSEAIELVSASAITDIFYVLRKATQDKTKALMMLKDMRKFIGVLPVTENDIDRAIDRNWKDFEDAVQYTVAESNGVDFIITRDQNGFEEKTVPSMSPKEFLDQLNDGNIII